MPDGQLVDTPQDNFEAALKPVVYGCILCGGQSRRMHYRDKAQVLLNGSPLLKRVFERLAPQVKGVVLSVNNPADIHRSLGIPLIEDQLPGQLGPLVGILSAMEYVATNDPSAQYLLSVATDTPFFPRDLVGQLLKYSASDTKPRLSVCASNEREHPTMALWPMHLRPALKDYLLSGKRKLMAFTEQYDPAIVHFTGVFINGLEMDPFFNINQPDDLDLALMVDEALSAYEAKME
ncbi:molybdenum cofactor guanylyltransferase MobA [Polycladidibacter stylochi]|uniref:molybdenum cofactor guanylyltransferase MobA n=1 Tax=Polycladidibacter stylochi TaxID=1807766 RepID=UPI00082BF28A|nr:molybdenum cofactor guanylyltransferase MobA [Pseudovibrio stylochi]